MISSLTDFSKQITGAVKAELARRDMTGVNLVGVLDLGRNAVYARLRGETPFNTEDLAKIAAHLDISIELLLASAYSQQSAYRAA